MESTFDDGGESIGTEARSGKAGDGPRGRTLVRAKRTLAGGSDRVQRHARRAIDAGDSYVRDNPWQAVGIGATAGLIVGLLVARRYSRKPAGLADQGALQ